jgi:hypothetical protein
MSKVTFQDLYNATPKELKKTYKLTDRQLEQQVRRHLDGANASDRRGLYEATYNTRHKN